MCQVHKIYFKKYHFLLYFYDKYFKNSLQVQKY